MIVPVILSGGSGTRLWPLSREAYPKQLLPLLGEQTLIQSTVSRVEGMSGCAAPLVVCNEDHRFLVAEQMRALGVKAAALLLEPVARNTAPAVAVAAFEALSREADPFLLVLPADHMIGDTALFRDTVGAALPLAEEGYLVTFGVLPEGPETGYGYIRRGGSLVAGEGAPAYRVERFVEKPDAATAAGYVADGEHFWNSGMFLFKASVYLQELESYAPEIHAAAFAAHTGRYSDLDFVRLDAEAFSRSPSDSIDYAVMERTRRAAVVALRSGWSDVGSWGALWEALEHDARENVISGDVLVEGVERCYVHATDRLVAAIGVEDQVIVETADAVLVVHRERVQEVKGLVDRLRAEGRMEAVTHRRVYRPWGWYETIAWEQRFKAKHICVNPGASLSLQLHHHRAEHWVVVKGTARIQCGEESLLLGENESTYIHIGVKHRLENPGLIPLEIIEVQSGTYLGEDDIVRLDDRYGR